MPVCQPAGSIKKTNPVAGTSLALGSTIDLVVSLGPQDGAIPDVIGLTQAAAESAIINAGFSVGEVSSQYHPTIAVGIVISQNPMPLTNNRFVQPINIVLSAGVQPPPSGEDDLPWIDSFVNCWKNFWS